MEHSAAGVQSALDSTSPVSGKNHERIATFFLGSKAENQGIFKKFLIDCLHDHIKARVDYSPKEPACITTDIQESQVFQDGLRNLEKNFNDLSKLLKQYAVPSFSPSYTGDMCFEASMPVILGYIMTMLYNPNNVAFESSPITTFLELDVGAQLCRMLGYTIKADSQASGWVGITCDSTVANLESIWAARDLKFYPLSLCESMKEGGPLAFIADTFKIHPCAYPDEEVLFYTLHTWDLLNLQVQDILDIPSRIQKEYGISPTFLQLALEPYLLQTTGKDALQTAYGIVLPPQYLISSTKHYSWPKSAGIAGIGSENMVNIPVDANAHVRVDLLREALQERLNNKQPIYAVVAIIGSTENGAVDPLDDILKLRAEFQAKGMSFVVHADAAWGGYFASMLRERDALRARPGASNDGIQFVPSGTLRSRTLDQVKALQLCDSITIDPHKLGYIPYPTGGLGYKDGRMRFLLTSSAPDLTQGSQGETTGIYGVEGSKPGAAVSAAWLHHQVVGLDKLGHGMLLGEVSFICSWFSAAWAAMSDSSTPFIVVPLNPLVNEPDEVKVEEEKAFIREHILDRPKKDLLEDGLAMKELRAIGSDLNINAFACNFRVNGKINTDVEEANYLNSRVFQALSLTGVEEKPAKTLFFLGATTLKMGAYGECCTNFKKRMGLETESHLDLFILRNVVTSPFQTSGKFVKELTDDFKNTLERELEVVVARNTIKPQLHSFILQGTNKLFLVYNPTFHNANGRHQLIVAATIVYILTTSESKVLDELLATGSITGNIRGKDLDLHAVHIKLDTVLKARTLESRYRDQAYSTLGTPFYLYGTQGQQHIDHMLLRAPNAQLSAEYVQLELDTKLSDDQLSKGVILYIDRLEAAMQPIDANNPPIFFAPGATFNVAVYEDKNSPIAHGPGLATVDPQDKIGTGKVTLGRVVQIDYVALNAQEFGDVTPNVSFESSI